MGIIDFLFGKKPKMHFSKEGKTSHDLGQAKWASWRDRFDKNPNYDFSKHAGTEVKVDKLKSEKPK